MTAAQRRGGQAAFAAAAPSRRSGRRRWHPPARRTERSHLSDCGIGGGGIGGGGGGGGGGGATGAPGCDRLARAGRGAYPCRRSLPPSHDKRGMMGGGRGGEREREHEGLSQRGARGSYQLSGVQASEISSSENKHFHSFLGPYINSRGARGSFQLFGVQRAPGRTELRSAPAGERGRPARAILSYAQPRPPESTRTRARRRQGGHQGSLHSLWSLRGELGTMGCDGLALDIILGANTARIRNRHDSYSC